MSQQNYNELDKEQLVALVQERDKDIIKKDQQIVKSESKAVALSSQLAIVNQNPDIAIRRQEMEYELAMARQFSASGAFKNMTPEQCYVVIKAGKEMGLKEMESMQALSIINGSVDFYGDKMIARLTGKGYKIEYENEITEKDKEQVTAKVTCPNGTVIRETAKCDDQIILKSQAAKFAMKNKLRFHAVRMIASFHLPHLFSAVTDIFTKDFHEYEEINTTKNNAVVPVVNHVPNSEELNMEMKGDDTEELVTRSEIAKEQQSAAEPKQEAKEEEIPEWAR